MATPDKNEKLWNTTELSEYLSVHRLTLQNWIRSGKLHAFKLGKDWRVRQSELDRFVAAAERAGDAQPEEAADAAG